MNETAFFCPIPTARSVRQGLATGKYQFAPDGDLEMRCTHCQEYWPADTEFFYGTLASLNSWCCACLNERKREKRKAA